MKYRKAKELIDQAADTLETYDDADLIDYSKYYKILRRCNADLGAKINPDKTYMVRIRNYRGVLPDDFIALNYALLCYTKEVNVTPPSGFQIEYKTIERKEKKCNSNPCLTECDHDYVIYQYLDDNWAQYKNLEPVKVVSKSFDRCSETCPNMYIRSTKSFEIGDDNQITTDFEKGDIYISYVGSMEDEEGDLLVIDDPMVEPYYENELIRSMLKDMLYNKQADVSQLYADAKVEASRARSRALTYVNTPGYEELKGLIQAQRVRLYKKYFVPFIGWNC